MHPLMRDLVVDAACALAPGPCRHHLDLVPGGSERPDSVVDERPGEVTVPPWIRGGEDADAAHAGRDIAGAEPTWPRRPRRAAILNTNARPSRNRIGYTTVVSRMPDRQ